MFSENKARDLDAGDSSWMRDQEEQIRGMLEEKNRVGLIASVSIVAGIVSMCACIFLFTGSAALSCTPEVCSYPMLLGVPDYDLAAVAFVLFVTALIVANFLSKQRNKLRSRINGVESAITTAIGAQCPICKKLSAREYVGRELLSHNEHLGSVVDPVTTEISTQVPLKDPQTGLTTYETSTSYSTAYVPRTAGIVDEDYELSYKCKFCNSMWKEPEHSSHEV